MLFVGLRADGKFCWGEVILDHIYLQPFEHEQLQSMIMLDLTLALRHSKCYRLGSLPHLKCYQRPELHHVAPSPAEVSMGMNVMHTARAEPAAFGGRLTFLFCRLQPGQERTGRCLR